MTRPAHVALAVALAGMTAACSSGSHPAASAPTNAAPYRPAARPPEIAWSTLHNPRLSSRHYAVKDGALVYANGTWHALFSAVDRAGVWRIGLTSSTQLPRWSGLSMMPHDPEVEGEASPDVVPTPDGGMS
jgi:hypothetical protein